MLKEKFSLEGKRGIVTGASRGLGKGMAAGLAEMGANLVLAARSKDALDAVASELSSFGGKMVACKTDVGNDDDLKTLVETAKSELGGIDFVFCNAGIIRRGATNEHDMKDFDDVMKINVHSVFALAKLASQVMIDQGTGGSIVMTDSVTSFHGSLNVPGYTASKGAVHMLARAMANDLGKYNIRVNTIGPGFMETEMTEGVRNREDRFNYLSSRMALDRWGTPEDLAGAAVYLASDASSYVTGATLYVDGGFLGM